MFRFRSRSGISDYKNICNAILLKICFFLHISVNCVSYLFIFAIKWVGLGGKLG